RQQRGAQWRYCRRADRRRNNAETICDRAWPAVSQGGKPTLSQFTSSPRTEDSRRDGLAGAQARTAQETLSEKSEARTQSSEVVRRIRPTIRSKAAAAATKRLIKKNLAFKTPS